MSKTVKPSTGGNRGLKPSAPPPVPRPSGPQKHGYQPSAPPPSRPTPQPPKK